MRQEGSLDLWPPGLFFSHWLSPGRGGPCRAVCSSVLGTLLSHPPCQEQVLGGFEDHLGEGQLRVVTCGGCWVF